MVLDKRGRDIDRQTDRQKKRKEEIPLFLPNATVKDLMWWDLEWLKLSIGSGTNLPMYSFIHFLQSHSLMTFSI